MKRILVIALTMTFSTLLTAAPSYTGNDKKEVLNTEATVQTDKTQKSSVNDKKESRQKSADGSYRDMQRGRRVLEHKYNLYA